MLQGHWMWQDHRQKKKKNMEVFLEKSTAKEFRVKGIDHCCETKTAKCWLFTIFFG
jgi:hypothetical protein